MSIRDNTTELQNILSKVNGLPDKSEGNLEDALIMRTLSTYSNPRVSSIDDYKFYNYSTLTTVSFPACTSIGNDAFYNCTSLSSIYLMGSTVCTLATSSVFKNTGITSSKGSIFVPATLVDQYKTATNWNYFSNVIYPLSSFDLDGAKYCFEEGMTWGDWVNSEYNTSGFYVDDDNCITADGNKFIWEETKGIGAGIMGEVNPFELINISEWDYFLDTHSTLED